MPTDEDTLRRIIREEIAAALAAAPRARLNGHPVSPELSAKRSQVAKDMWEKRKALLSTALSTASAAKPKARKKPAAKQPVESTFSTEFTSKLYPNLDANKQAPEQTPGTRAFKGYAEAYVKRYGEFPVRNAKANTLLKQLVGRLGDGESAPVAAYYVGLDDRLYAGSGHCLSLLVRDAEKLRTLWKQRATTTTIGAPAKPWWETWPALEEQGRDLGIEQGDNPRTFRVAVLRAAFVAGRLPPEIAAKLGVDRDPVPGA